MRFIFLDIDGVLNSVRWFQYIDQVDPDTPKPPMSVYKRESRHLDPYAIRLLASLMTLVPDARIVVSSSWRILFDNETIVELLRQSIDREKLLARGRHIIYDGWFIDQTPREIPNRSQQAQVRRGEEIQWWMMNRAAECAGGSDKIGGYVILDDDRDMLPYQQKNFVHTSGQDGLTADNVVEAYRILMKK